MGISNTFKITGSALSAQSIHIDMIAKNMANSQVMSGTEAVCVHAQFKFRKFFNWAIELHEIQVWGYKYSRSKDQSNGREPKSD